jgi:hypothetical protein
MVISPDILTQQLALADELLAGRDTMLEPQALPGRYGRVVKAVDQLLAALDCPAVVAGGWAVWRHGFVGRVTQDLDIVLPANQLAAFLQAAALSGFVRLSLPPGRWPKLQHKDTGIDVDVLPEGGRPGTTNKPAPTTIPHPTELGAGGTSLRYIDLPHLVELKLAAGRIGDEHDVVELIRANRDAVDAIRQHLATVHATYVTAFERLRERADEQV